MVKSSWEIWKERLLSRKVSSPLPKTNFLFWSEVPSVVKAELERYLRSSSRKRKPESDVLGYHNKETEEIFLIIDNICINSACADEYLETLCEVEVHETVHGISILPEHSVRLAGYLLTDLCYPEFISKRLKNSYQISFERKRPQIVKTYLRDIRTMRKVIPIIEIEEE